jgi:hypothetical protein
MTMCCQPEKDWRSTELHALTRLLLWSVGVMMVNLMIPFLTFSIDGAGFSLNSKIDAAIQQQ